MNKILSVLLSFVMIFSFSITVFASENVTDLTRIRDYEDILTDEEMNVLEIRTKNTYEKYGFDIFCVLTEAATEDEIYSFSMYSQLSQFSGRYDMVLVIISEDNGLCLINPYGKTSETLTDDGILEIKDTVQEKVDQRDFFAAFGGVITECDRLFKNADIKVLEESNEEPEQEETEKYDPFGKKRSRKNDNVSGIVFTGIVVAVVLGCLSALIVCTIYKSQMNNTGVKTEAKDYMSGNLNLTENSETLIKKKVTKKKLENTPPSQK